ncbi:MAG: helix-turn-helix transcriptional regulator [Pseudomonadota bacterium]
MQSLTRGAVALRSRRLSEGLSQYQWATRLNITPSYISQIERGVVIPGQLLLERLRDALRIPVAWWATIDEKRAAKR